MEPLYPYVICVLVGALLGVFATLSLIGRPPTVIH